MEPAFALPGSQCLISLSSECQAVLGRSKIDQRIDSWVDRFNLSEKRLHGLNAAERA